MRCPSGLSTTMTALFMGSAFPTIAHAQSTGLEDMVGARAGQAEMELQRRGYVNIRGEQGDDRVYTYWWNADRRQCVSIATMEGRYNSIQPTTSPDCRKPANLRPDLGHGGQAAPRPRPDYDPDLAYGRAPAGPGGGQDRYSSGGPVVDGRNVELGLVCFGDGSKTGFASGTTWNWNRDRDRYESGTYTETRKEVFDASLMVQTWAGGGRIRLPKSLIPPINSRGNQGWWDLYDVTVSPDTVRASYRLNGLNKPRLVIDRRSGRITVTGMSDYGFRGTCDLIGHEPRRF
ncbi:conserved exported hypothetical protein [Sphingomonas sp. T1]|nr:conserved exported hypothetical protein [Sphingomonas sp. T1]